jgi:hypothetical protein
MPPKQSPTLPPALKPENRRPKTPKCRFIDDEAECEDEVEEEEEVDENEYDKNDSFIDDDDDLLVLQNSQVFEPEPLAITPIKVKRALEKKKAKESRKLSGKKRVLATSTAFLDEEEDSPPSKVSKAEDDSTLTTRLGQTADLIRLYKQLPRLPKDLLLSEQVTRLAKMMDNKPARETKNAYLNKCAMALVTEEEDLVDGLLAVEEGISNAHLHKLNYPLSVS